ncbi:Hsp70 family protein [Methylosinus sp. 3S-1]|uniref:Hsp70 family protein n=2 Tax=Methylocystaceae TaxID=31993 RepID=A0A2D2D0J8_METT3|nr:MULTISPECIES: Hsp70 family protein [Methylosinus]ATQ68516.1 Hsp70 family protein [Methylosinus trichosporium OB3b]OBS53951.1 heat-shock protein [Methylosinus sp. 3S-1]
MMRNSFCGLDFGTSNSTVARGSALVPVEGDKLTIPSSIFFDFEEGGVRFGREALRAYVEGTDGRLMRSLKSVLGHPLLDETVRIKRKAYTYGDIIGLLVAHLKRAADAAAGADVTHVVMGRPVRFVDDDAGADAKAQDALERIARAQGFAHVEFQYEPIAAALDYERTVAEEQYALIADIGGGTSDFSIVRVSPQGAARTDRSADVLANQGVHIGGTDFDRLLSMKAVMPHFGLASETKSHFGGKILPVPNGYFVDLATWHRINLLYTQEVARELADLEKRSLTPQLLRRLREVIEARHGHTVALGVEAAKIALSAQERSAIDLSEIEPGLAIETTRGDLQAAVETRLASLRAASAETLAQAGIAAERIDAIFLTGGSTAIPAVREAVTAIAPRARVVEGDMFGSVGLGLGLDAARRFL